MSSVSGGEKLKAHLARLAANLASAKSVSVGFLDRATYANGENAARLLARAKTAAKDGHPEWTARLTAWGNWSLTHGGTVGIAQVAFWMEFGTTRTAPRPFFRQTIVMYSGEWGQDLAKFLKTAKYDARIALGRLGLRVSEQIRTSIIDWAADNRPLTAYIKGFNHGLIDRGVMQHHVDSVVT
jgi:hypothetical protein